MTGTDDRLDADVRTDAEICAALQSELRDARAEVERQRARSDAAERMLAYQLPMVEAELAAERAKVERVEAFLTDAERGDKGASRVVYCAGVRAALAGGEQGE